MVQSLGERLIFAARRADGEDRAGGAPHHGLGDAADERVQPTDAAVRSHHDEVVAALSRDSDDLAQRIASLDSPRHTAADPRPRSFDRCVHFTLSSVLCDWGRGCCGADLEIVGCLDVEDVDGRSAVLCERYRLVERGNRGRRTVERNEQAADGLRHALDGCKPRARGVGSCRGQVG